MKPVFFIALLCILFQAGHAQSSLIVFSDHRQLNNPGLLDQGDIQNCRSIFVYEKGQPVEYFPAQVEYYRLPDGRKYVSKMLVNMNSTQNVFMMELKQGELTLYKHFTKNSSIFYFEKNGILTAVPEKRNDNIHPLLLELTGDKPYMEDLVPLVRRNNASLSNMTKIYNGGRWRPLPCDRITVTAGSYHQNFLIPENLTGVYGDSSGLELYTLSLGYDHPLSASAFSFQPTVRYSVSDRMVNHVYENDHYLRMLSLSLPVIYAAPIKYVRPFVGAGPEITYLNYIFSDPQVVTYSKTIFDHLFAGFSLQAGLQFPMYKRISACVLYEFKQDYAIGVFSNKVKPVSHSLRLGICF
ncbi:MAG: hypothetical protein ACOYXB_13375 [Bacteroidota bacterium]